MKRSLTFLAIFFIALTACKKETKEPEPTEPKYEGSVTVTFDALVGKEDFALNKDFTINNRTYKFEHFRYWVSNVVLIKTDGSEYPVPKSYYLIEERSALGILTKREEVAINDIPAGSYKAVRFSIGVDAAHNDNLSLQDGELSLTKNMTNVDGWGWNTSYIFTALRGNVIEGATTQWFQVETGLNTNYKTITLELPKTKEPTSTTLKLNVDVAKIIDGLDLIKTYFITANAPTSMKTVSANYETKVYSIVSAD